MNIKDFFIAEANKYNHYLPSETENQDKKCIDCVRKHYSYPDCCNEGWNHMSKTGCLNFKSKEEK